MSAFTPDDYQTLEFHPACLTLPQMDEADYQKLKEDIAAHGLRHPITLHQGMILDGRNRFEACIDLGIVPTFTEWEGGADIVEFVLGENLYRRHLTASQKAMVATAALEFHREAARSRMAEAGKSRIEAKDPETGKFQGSAPGAPSWTEDAQSAAESSVTAPGAVSREDPEPRHERTATAAAAKQVGVSPRTVEQAVYVKQHGTPDDAAEVLAGKTSVKAKAAEIKARTAQPAPKGPTAKDAMKVVIHINGGLGTLPQVMDVMLPEDAAVLIKELRRTLERLVARFEEKAEGSGHA